MDKIFNSFTGEEERPQIGYNCLDFSRMMEILEMAKKNKIPDGNFSDFEIEVWSNFKSIIF